MNFLSHSQKQPGDLALYRLNNPCYFGLHDPAIGPIACGGRAELKALLVGGRRIVEDDCIPGIDLAELGQQSRAAIAALAARDSQS